MRLLKQSTAVTIRMGPALDKTDGITEETALTLTVEVSKNNGAFAARNSAGAISHDSNGWYAVPLDATDTGILGPFIAKFDDAATHLPVWHEFMVLPAMVYDSLVAGSDTLQADVVQWNGTAVPAEHTAGYPIVTVKDGTGTGELDTAFGVVLAKDHAGANLATQASVDTLAGYVDTEVAAIKAKTDNLPSDPAGLDGLAAAHGSGSWATATGFAVPGDAMTLTTAEREALHNIIFTRSMSFAEDAAAEHSLCTAIMAGLESSRVATVWTIRKTTGATLFVKTITIDAAADLVTGVT
jgi:hypothetical protein